MKESFDDQMKKLKELMERNDLPEAERLSQMIAREYHLELMHNLKQQREELLALNKLLAEHKKNKKDWLRNSSSPN